MSKQRTSMSKASLTASTLAEGFGTKQPGETKIRKTASRKAESSGLPQAENSATPIGITKYTLMIPNDLVNEFEELYAKLAMDVRRKNGSKLKKNEFTRQVLRFGLDESKLRGAFSVAA